MQNVQNNDNQEIAASSYLDLISEQIHAIAMEIEHMPNSDKS